MNTLAAAIRRRAGLLALGISCLAFTACPMLIGGLTAKQVTDKSPPTVTIVSPSNNVAYTQLQRQNDITQSTLSVTKFVPGK